MVGTTFGSYGGPFRILIPVSQSRAEMKFSSLPWEPEISGLHLLLVYCLVCYSCHEVCWCPLSLIPILRLRQVLLLDSGGQPQLHEVLPVFLNGASKFLYVHKLHESLGKRPTIRYVIKDKVVGCLLYI